MVKRFLYCEETYGGMNSFEFSDVNELSCLYGWGTDFCKDYDTALILWIDSCEIGEYFNHRLGIVVRLKDS